MDTFEIIKIAYRSRMLFRTEGEYRGLTGVSFETVCDHRGDKGEMKRYYRVLDRECMAQCDVPLRDMVDSYVRMSRICKGEGFDWGERRQLALRKRFCRRVFRTATARVCRVTAEEEEKFRCRECDDELLEALFPAGLDGEGKTDMIFLLLITFGVIRPLTGSRGRDMTDEELGEQIGRITGLVEVLRDDFPTIGMIDKPVVFDNTLHMLEEDAADIHDPSVAALFSVVGLYNVLDQIVTACRYLASPECCTENGIRASGYSMPGIWVDDRDEGRTRFWVFPENKIMAFCYYLKDGYWHLRPYEFCFLTSNREEGFGPECVWVTLEGNRQILDRPGEVMDYDQKVTTLYELEERDRFWPFGKISFECAERESPGWFDWTSFRKLGIEDPRHGRFREVLEDIYDPRSPLSVLFTNDGEVITDAEDALVGIDKENVYVTASVSGRRHRLWRDEEDEEMYWYDAGVKAGGGRRSLLGVEISREAPLYVIPRFREPANRLSATRLRFAEAVRNLTLDHSVTIYPTRACREGLLCLNDFSLIVLLDAETLAEYGIRRVESRRELLMPGD